MEPLSFFNKDLYTLVIEHHIVRVCILNKAHETAGIRYKKAWDCIIHSLIFLKIFSS